MDQPRKSHTLTRLLRPYTINLPMRIFVTGGTGFIGSALIKRLFQMGHEVVALARNLKGLTASNLEKAIPVEGDLSDSSLLYRAMKGCQQVYHLAALARSWAPLNNQFDRTNIEGTRNILEACKRAHVERMVYTSTVMAIGPTDGFVADESRANSPRPLSHYQRTKAEAETVVASYAKEGLPVLMVLPTMVYGRGISHRRISFNRFLQDFLRGLPLIIPGNGSQQLNCAYLDDVVTGHLLAMEHGKTGERYILGGENIHLHDLEATVNRIAGMNRKIFFVPFWMAKMAGWVEEARARLMRGSPMITWSSVETYRRSWAYSSKKAMTELRYSPRPLSEGLKLTMEWLREMK